MLNIQNVKKGHSLAKNKNNSAFNCWGATLYALGQANNLSWVNMYYMTAFLQEHTILQTGELKRGDILVLYNECEELEHTAVYIGRGLYWHKRGGRHSEITSKKGVMEAYSRYCDFTLTEVRRLNKTQEDKKCNNEM